MGKGPKGKKAAETRPLDALESLGRTRTGTIAVLALVVSVLGIGFGPAIAKVFEAPKPSSVSSPDSPKMEKKDTNIETALSKSAWATLSRILSPKEELTSLVPTKGKPWLTGTGSESPLPNSTESVYQFGLDYPRLSHSFVTSHDEAYDCDLSLPGQFRSAIALGRYHSVWFEFSLGQQVAAEDRYKLVEQVARFIDQRLSQPLEWILTEDNDYALARLILETGEEGQYRLLFVYVDDPLRKPKLIIEARDQFQPPAPDGKGFTDTSKKIQWDDIVAEITRLNK